MNAVEMTPASADLAALVASRLCHDLISPIGAIGNGVELIAEDPGEIGEELALIEMSARSVDAKLRFFRLAFGHAAATSTVREEEVQAIVAGYFAEARMRVHWTARPGLQARGTMRLLLLLLLAAETALPLGGGAEIRLNGATVEIALSGRRVGFQPQLLALLLQGAIVPNLAPAHVQFALARADALRHEVRLSYAGSEAEGVLRAENLPQISGLADGA
ncbi:MAG: histidine phosphotransferase family protein [Pseudomonadota bacterium]